MAFLDEWDRAIERALDSGRIAFVTRLEETRGPKGALITAVVKARTRHPAFMGAPIRKHDPERDQ